MLDDVANILHGNGALADTGEPQSAAAIDNAEGKLGVKFPKSFREYIARWGWVSFGPNEYFGLGSAVNDVVERTMRARERKNLPAPLVMICDHDGDEYVCIDTENCPHGDCRIVVWDVPTQAISRIRSDGFENFLTSDLRDFIE